MNTAKRMMITLVVMVMVVMVLPSTSAEAAKTNAKLNKKNVYLAINDGENDKISKETAKYTLKLTGVSKKAAKKAKWSSANKKIATVSKKGIVTGKKHGSTKITCKVGKTKYTCIVCVNDIQKVIKGATVMHSGMPTWITVSVAQMSLWEYDKGMISADEISDSGSRATIGSEVKINGHWYFFYHQRWYKKYAHIKEGRLNSKDINAKCNIDPEYKKAQDQKKEDAAKARAEKEAKEKAEAEALAKAQAEAQAKAEAEAKAKAEAEAKAKEELTKTIEAAGGEIKIADGEIVMVSWNNTEEERIEGIEAAGGKITYLNDGTDSYMITWDDTEDLGYKIVCDNYGYRIIWDESY